MKNIFRLGMMVVVLATITSCSEILPKKVKSIVIKEGDYTIDVLQFDSKGRVIEFDNKEYQYANNQIIIKDSKRNGVDTLCEIEKGRIVFQNNYLPTKYSYSDKGYLERVTFNDVREMYSFTINDGRMDKCKIRGEEYKFLYKNTRNNLNVDLSYIIMVNDWELVFTGLLGERLDFLPSAIISDDNKDAGKFSYEYDGKYLTKITMGDGRDDICFEIYY